VYLELIAATFFAVAAVLLVLAVRGDEYRGLMSAAGVAALVASGYALYTASLTDAVGPQAPDRGQQLITIHGAAPPASPPAPEPPGVGPFAVEGETPRNMVIKMGCGVCHQIPGIQEARSGNVGPLLIGGVTAEKRLASEAYQVARQANRARATTPREYLIESILAPHAFVVPGFELTTRNESPMPDHYSRVFTMGAVERLADFLVTLDCRAATRDGLNGPPLEPVKALCPGS